MSTPTAPPERVEQADEDRRRFLKSCGRFAGTVPPAMVLLLSTSLSSEAIAKSSGGHGRGGKWGGGPKPGRGPKSGRGPGAKH